MPLPKRRTWFLIADGARMRLFSTAGYGKAWELIGSADQSAALKPTHELGRDRPGRGRKIGPDSRYAVGEEKEHDKLENAFVSDVAMKINDAASKGEFEQLVLAAPPRALGLLRTRLHADAISKCIGVFDKDLTNIDETELHEYFRERLVSW